MGRPRQVSDDEILAVARTALTADPTVSTVTIAARAGLSQAALFKRFGTKMQLVVRALGVPQTPPWVALLEHGPDDRPIPDQLHELGVALDDFFHTMVPRMAALKAIGCGFRELFGGDVPPPVIGVRALSAWMERAASQGRIHAPEPAGVAIAFLGAFQGRAFWQHLAGEHLPPHLGDREAYVRHVVALFWRGIAPQEEA